MKRCLIIQERHNTARFTQTWRCAQLKEEGLHVHVAMAPHLHNSQGNKYTANLASNPVFGCKKQHGIGSRLLLAKLPKESNAAQIQKYFWWGLIGKLTLA